MKLSWTHLAIVGLVVFVLANTCFGCMREGMSALKHKMGEGVKDSWDTREMPKGVSSLEWRKQNHDSYASDFVGPSDNMNFFSKTKFDVECCGSSYTSSGGLLADGSSTNGGCACMTPEQIDYLNSRGGNRTNVSEF